MVTSSSRLVFFHLSVVGSRGQQPKQGSPDCPLPCHLVQLFPGDPEAFPGQPRDIVSPACPGSTTGRLPVGRAQNTSPGRCPGGILIRCPSHLFWLLSTWRSPSEPLLDNQASPPISKGELKTKWRKHISSACPGGLVLRHCPQLITIDEWRNGN